MIKQTKTWTEWDQEFKKILYERMGDGVAQLYNDINTRDYFHDMYQRGLSTLDALKEYIQKGSPKSDTYRIA